MTGVATAMGYQPDYRLWNRGLIDSNYQQSFVAPHFYCDSSSYADYRTIGTNFGKSQRPKRNKNAFTKTKCMQFFQFNKQINPFTGRPLTENSPMYNKLLMNCTKYQQQQCENNQPPPQKVGTIFIGKKPYIEPEIPKYNEQTTLQPQYRTTGIIRNPNPFYVNQIVKVFDKSDNQRHDHLIMNIGPKRIILRKVMPNGTPYGKEKRLTYQDLTQLTQ